MHEQKMKMIKRWMRAQGLENYFDGFCSSDFAQYTALGEEASAHFDYHEGSTDDELCFELAMVLLDQLIARQS